MTTHIDESMYCIYFQVPCVELGNGKLLDESNSTAWLLSPESMLGGGEKAAQAEVEHIHSICLVLILT